VTAEAGEPSVADRAGGDPAPLVPTATAHNPAADPADRVPDPADRATIAEIAEFLRHLRTVSAGSDGPAERAAFLARKADLFARIDAQRARPADPPAPLTPPTPEGRTP
jgi:hypothetical protein